MKKIIYSLVIMIAAGSLFTSCIEPVEPVGIYDLREAKARYYDALSKLRIADAGKVDAEADLKRAEAEHERALVANQMLLNEYQQLLNEAKAQQNAEDIAKWELEIDSLLTIQEIERLGWQERLAKAQESLRQALSEIEMAALDLTTAEATALAKAIKEYEDAFKNWTDAKEAVTKAEAALWQAKYEIENSTDSLGLYFDFSGSSIRTGEDLGEYYQSGIDYYKNVAEYWAALLESFEGDPEIEAWAKELTALKDSLTEAKASRYIVTKDSVEYMMDVYHDGVHAYEMQVAEWVKNNPEVTNPGKAPKPQPASNFYADTITFPVFKVAAPDAAILKLQSMLYGYGQESPASKADPKNNILYNDGSNVMIVANQAMKDFILGTATSTNLEYTWVDEDENEHTIYAQYGLNGAISTLERELVLGKNTGKSKEELEKDAKDALDQWQADRDSIIALYDAQKADKNVAEAYEPLATALAALKTAKENAAAGNGSLAKAAEELIAAVNGAITHGSMSTPDSTTVIDAFRKFAQAREAYLDYKPYQNGVEYDNKNMFYFALSITPTLIVDSIEFNKLTLDHVRKYGGYAYDVNGALVATGGDAESYVHIAKQLLGPAFATAIDGTWPLAPIADATIMNNDGFYGEYMYVAGTPAVIKTAGGGEFTPKAITTAVEAVAAAADALNDLWERFWDEYLGAACDAAGEVTIPTLNDKYDPRCYELATFTEPYIATVFDGLDIRWTANLGAILGSVDPNATSPEGYEFQYYGLLNGAAIFEGSIGNRTDFYQVLYTAVLAQGSDFTESLDKIKAWRDGVVAAFAKDSTDAIEKAKDASEKDSTNYVKNKAKYDKYFAARKAFTGMDAKDTTKFNPIVTTIGAPDANYAAAGVKQTEKVVYVWEGVWDLAGEQAKLAEECLPGYPEKLAEWHTAAIQLDHKIIHLEEIINTVEKAYLAAVAVLYDDAEILVNYESIEEYYEDLLDGIVKFLQANMEAALAKVSTYTDALAKFNAGYDAKQIAIEVLENALANAKLKFADAEAKLEVAKAFYDAVLAKILGNN